MTAFLIAAFLSLCSLAVLCGPPAFALRMLWLRLRSAGPQGRPAYRVLCAAMVLLMAFNALFSLGITGPLRALSPSFVAANLGTAALLLAWAAAGVCAILAVIAPRRDGAPQI